MKDELPDEYGRHVLDDGRILYCQGDGHKMIVGPAFPEIFSKGGVAQTVNIFPDGREILRDGVDFRGEKDEVREELEKILASWPSGICDKGTFAVSVSVTARIK